jgi:hypothetical protein
LKLKSLKLLLIVVSGLFLQGCFESQEPDIYENVTGTVTYQNEPLAGADIYIRNNFDPGGYDYELATREEYTIEINVPESDSYTGSLSRFGADTVFTDFFNGELTSGVKSLTIPEEHLSNGVIGYLVRNEAYQIASNLFLVNRPDSVLLQTIPFSKTNNQGYFSLNSLNLAFGQSFNTGLGGVFSVTDTLQIIIATEQEILTKKEVIVERNQPNYFEIDID